MKLLLSSLLLTSLCALSIRSASSDKFLVTQSPDVFVREGEKVSITCCLTGEFERATVNWLKNQTSIGDEILMKNSEGSLQKNTPYCSSKTFINIRREDSERYICKVDIEIPFHVEVRGPGTLITVTARVNAMDDTGEGASSDKFLVTQSPDVLDDTGERASSDKFLVTQSPDVLDDTGERASSDKFLVTQSPDVFVREGEKVSITCCLTGEFERATVNWLKNQTSIGDEILMKNSEGSLQKNTPYCSSKTFINIRREDSQRYICKVDIEIPFHVEVRGPGTLITVTARVDAMDDTGEESHWEDVLIHVLRCLPVLALVVSFFCLNRLGTKAQQRAQVVPGNKLPSEQGTEEDQYEKGGDEKETEEENKNRDEESHALSAVSSDSSRVGKDEETLAVSSQRLSA